MTAIAAKPRIEGYDICKRDGRHTLGWLKDYEGDPGVINGIHDLSRWQCVNCEMEFGGSKSSEPDAELEGGDCNEDDSEGDDE